MEYGSWTLVEPGGRKSLVRCRCGTERWVQTAALKAGRSTNCGCLSFGKPRPVGYRLKPSADTDHPLYHLWKAMLRRCNDPKTTSYPRYGGRGISVCERWRAGDGPLNGFQCFAADVGDRPPGLTLERIDNDGGYEPTNVRWATYSEQQDNTAVAKARGDRTYRKAATRLRTSQSTVQARVSRGWSADRAMTEPVARQAPDLTEPQRALIRARYVPRDPQNGARALARELGVSDRSVRRALKV